MAQVPAQDDELPTYATNGGAAVFTEVGDGLKVWRQVAGKPDQFKVALGLSLQATAGLQPVQIAVDVDLEQRRRMISGPACCLRLCPVKTQLAQVEFVNKYFNDAHGIIADDIVIKALRKQRALRTIFTLNKALHQLYTS